MFHLLHLIFLPLFLVFHVVGILILGIGVLVVMKAIRRWRAAKFAARFGPGSADTRGRAAPRNDAFEDYRGATLRKLELEADEFRKYLEGLRRAADSAAFETFMKSRRAEGGPAA